MTNRIKDIFLWTADAIFGYVAFTLLGRASDMIMGSPSAQGILGLFAFGVTIAILVYLLTEWRNREKKLATISPKLAHLTVHYSQRRDTPDTSSPAIPRFVSDAKRNKAYWVSDLLEPHVRRREVCWVSHDGERALIDYFTRLKIECIERNPLPEEIGLRFLSAGPSLLSEEEFEKADELVEKLKGRNLDNLRVIILYPWYCYFFRSLQGSTPSRRLLLKIHENQTFEAPLHDLALAEKEIIDSQTYARLPFESCNRWSKRKGYTFTPRRYTERELTEGS